MAHLFEHLADVVEAQLFLSRAVVLPQNVELMRSDGTAPDRIFLSKIIIQRADEAARDLRRSLDRLA